MKTFPAGLLVYGGTGGKTGCIRGCIMFSCMASPVPAFPSGTALQYERDYGNDNKDYYEPFCDFHSETGYSPSSQYKKNQSQYQEKYGKIN
jgi:hypothetical protein